MEPRFREHETGHWEIPIQMCDVALLLLGDCEARVAQDVGVDPETEEAVKGNLGLVRSLLASLKGIQESSLEEEKQHRRARKQHFQLERRVALLRQYKERYELARVEKVG